MAQKPETFAETLARIAGPLPSNRPAAPQKLDFSGLQQVQKDVGGSPPDPISWLLDMASRPLFSQTNKANSVLNQIEKSADIRDKFAHGDVLGGIGDVVGGAVDILTAPVRGLVSTNKEDKNYTSDLIEKGTDVIGDATNPGYVNEKDNVNPVLKGVLGFVGDVAADPLTYVPGAAIATAGRGIVKGARGAAALGKGAVEAARTAKGAGVAADVAKGEELLAPAEAAAMKERADLLANSKMYSKTMQQNIEGVSDAPGLPASVEASTKPVKPTSVLASVEPPAAPKPVSLVSIGDDGIARSEMTFDTVEEATTYARRQGLRERKMTKDGKPYKSQNARNTYQIVDNTPTPVVRPPAPKRASTQLKNDPRAQQGRALLESLGSPDAIEQAYKAQRGAKGNMLSAGEWLRAYAQEEPGFRFDVNLGGDRRQIGWTEIINNPKKYANLPEVQRIIGPTYKAYQKGFATNPGKVDLYGDALDEAALPQIPRPDSSKMARFERLLQNEAEGEDRVKDILGPHLFNRLKESHTPASFDKKVQETLDVFDRSKMLDNIIEKQNISTALKSVLGMTDVDVIGTNIARMNAHSNVAAVLGAEDAARQAVETSTQASQSVLDAVTKAMADDAVEKISPEMTAATKAERLANDDAQVKRVLGYLPKVLQDHFFNPTMKYRTKTGTARDSKVFGEGFGIEQRIFNGYAQWNTAQRTMQHWLDSAKTAGRGGKPLFGPQRSEYVRTGFLNDLKLIEDTLEREGYQMWYGIKKDAVPLRFSQMFEILDEARPRAMDKFYFNYDSMVAYTNLMNAVLHAAQGGSREEVIAMLANTALRNGKQGQINVNRLSQAGGKEVDRKIQHYANPNRKISHKQHLAQLQAKNPGARFIPNQNGTGYWRVMSTEELRNELADIIMEARPRMGAVIADNAESLKARIGTESAELSDAALSRLNELATDPQQLGAALRAVAHREENVAKMAEDGGATFDAENIATDVVNDNLEPAVVTNAEGVDKAAVAVARTGDPAARKAPLQEGFDQTSTIDNADDLALAAIERANVDRSKLPNGGVQVEIMDAQADAVATVGNGANRIMNALGRTFKANLGQERMYQVRHSIGNGSAARLKRASAELSAISRRHLGFVGNTQTKIIDAGWEAYRTGVPGASPEIAAAAEDIGNWMAKIVGGGDDLLGYSFARTPVSIEGLNARLASVGLDSDKFFFSTVDAKKAAAANGTDVLTEALKQWKTWDVTDPLDFMSRFYVAAEQLATDTAVVQGITRWMGNKGLVSKQPREGFAKMIFSGDSRYGDLFDGNLFWDKAVIKEIGIMDAVSRESRMFKGGFGTFVHDYFDTVQGAWKYAITLPRPGHHIRNMIGDMSMTWVAEGHRFWKRSSEDAWKILSARGKYTDIDVTRALDAYGVKELPKGGDVLMKGKNGFSDLTVDEITTAMFQHGLFNSYSSIEDLVDVARIGDAAPHGFEKVVKTAFLRGGKIEKTAGDVSEARDHLVRAQHFLQYVYKAIEDGRFKGDYDELFRNAAFQVKKHHPDGSMLSTNEAKILRRIIPFYSWMSRALPAIVEGAVLHPGRTIVFPKASYNLAVGMGIDPDSMYDPFPQDQLFPSFLTEQVLGPQFQLPGGEYLGTNPGIASVDIANMFGADPIRGIAGSVSPLIRIGPELLSGASWGTGAKIKDASDYLDSSIPGINYLANITGVSPTGSLVSAATGQGLDPQAQVAAENKGQLDQTLSALNWVTGLGFQNMSRPNYINYAEIEKRNREGEQRASF